MTSKVSYKTPPEVDGLPFFGSLPKVMKNPYEFLLNAREEYGDIYTLNLGILKMITVNHPDYAQYVLRDNHRNFVKEGPMWDTVGRFLGNGLPNSKGDYWLRQRRMLQPQFHKRRLANLIDKMIDAIDEELVYWDKFAESGSPINFEEAFGPVTLRVIVKTMFGTGLTKHETEQIGIIVNQLNDLMFRQVITGQLPSWLPKPGLKHFENLLQQLDDVLFSIIARYRREGEDENCLIAMLLGLVDEETGESMTDKELRDEALSIFSAGYETTAVGLSWTFYYLMRDESILKKLRQEIDDVIGKEKPTFEDSYHLPYAQMVFKEALRLRPPFAFIPRQPVEDDVIGGYRIPAGSMVVVLSPAIQHHPEIWEKPYEFQPDRFSDENDKKHHRFAFLPFGAGPRKCIGDTFAIMEAQLIMARILQKYELTAVSQEEVDVKLAITLKAKQTIEGFLDSRVS